MLRTFQIPLVIHMSHLSHFFLDHQKIFVPHIMLCTACLTMQTYFLLQNPLSAKVTVVSEKEGVIFFNFTLSTCLNFVHSYIYRGKQQFPASYLNT